MTVLRTEADVVATLAGRAVTIDELYAACEAAGVTDRGRGHDRIETHGGDMVWRRRVRNALTTLRRQGRAERIGRGTWVIDGSRDQPHRMLLVLCHREPSALELRLLDAESFLSQTDEPFDLVVADPPYGLYNGGVHEKNTDVERNYNRNGAMVVPGYTEVEEDYGEFTHRWMAAAARSLRIGAYLTVITGTSVAWRIGYAAHQLGLTEICQIAVQRRFALRHTRQPAHAHWVANVYSSGPKHGPHRFFHCPPELPKAASGRNYPLDIWAGDLAPPKAERRNALRYRNALPVELVDRFVRMLTPGPDNGHDPWTSLVADPFLGSGTTAIACLRRQRRFAGADINPHSLRFTAARITAEEIT